MTVTRGQVGDLYWHVHHDQLAEVLTQPIETRVDYINTHKPKHERETRLRWMTPVMGVDDPAWADLRLAWADREQALDDYGRAWDVYSRAWADRDRAWDVYSRAQAVYSRAQADLYRAWAALEPLHVTEHPGCPWDGQTLVFPKVTR